MRQRFVLVCLFLVVVTALCNATKPAPGVAGRWEGSVQIPGSPITIVVDLAQNKGVWVGSAIVPGFGVYGTPLADLAASASDVEFAMKKALGGATVKAHLEASEKLVGEFTLGGNKAPFILRRTGEAQVELPKPNDPVSKELEGEWRGSYQFVTSKLNVVLKLKAGNLAKPGELVVVDWGNATFPVELWTVDGDKVKFFVSDGGGITYEGEVSKDGTEFAGNVRHSIVEQPLNLKKVVAN